MIFENITSKNIQQKFSRFEMKYIIRKSISQSIQKEIRNFMVYDGYANKELKKIILYVLFILKIIIILISMKKLTVLNYGINIE